MLRHIAVIIASTYFTLTLEIESKGYMEFYKKLGDPLNVTCRSQNKTPVSWYFTSTLPYFDGFLFEDDDFHESMEDRYDLIISNGNKVFTLQVPHTDKHHSGSYIFIPDQSDTKNRHVIKLILIENSSIELRKDKNHQITLNMDITFVGLNAPTPLFRCFSSNGVECNYKTVCTISNEQFLKCGSMVVFSPHDVVPQRCQLYFKDEEQSEMHIWMEASLFLVPDERVVYLEEGKPWNMTCVTPFQAPMKWKFQSVSSNETTTLYEHFQIENKFQEKYHFSVSEGNKGNKTYTMFELIRQVHMNAFISLLTISLNNM